MEKRWKDVSFLELFVHQVNKLLHILEITNSNEFKPHKTYLLFG